MNSYEFPIRRFSILVGTTMLLFLTENLGAFQDRVNLNGSGRRAELVDVKPLSPESVKELVTIGKTQFRHAATIASVSFVPGRNQVITSGRDATARLWDLDSGKELMRFIHDDSVWTTKVVADGLQLLTGCSDGNVYRWNLQTGKKTKTYKTTQDVFRIALFPGGKKMLAVGDGGSASVWNIETGEQIKPLDPEKDDLYGCDISPDGKMFAICGDSGLAKLYNAQDYSELRPLKHEKKDVYTARFSPDSKQIVTCDADGFVRMFATDSGKENTGKEIWKVRFGNDVKTVDYSKDGKTVAISKLSAGAVIVNALDGKTIKEFKANSSTFWPVAFSSDQRKLFAGSAKDLVCWDVATQQQLTNAVSPDGFGTIVPLGVTADRKHLLIKENGDRLYSWNLAKENFDYRKKTKFDFNKGISMSADGRFIVVLHPPGIVDESGKKDVTPLELEELDLSIEEEVEIIEEEVEIIEEEVEIIEEVELELEEIPIPEPVGKLKIIDDSEPGIGPVFLARRIAFANESSLVVYNSIDLSVHKTVSVPFTKVEQMRFVGGGSLLLVQVTNKKTQIWNIATGTLHWELPLTSSAVKKIHADVHSNHVVTTHQSEGSPVYDIQNRVHIGTLKQKDGEINSCHFLPGDRGMILATKVGTDTRVSFWQGRQPSHGPKLTPAEVSKLLEQIDGDSFQAREAATVRLISEGGSVLDQIRITDDSSPEFCWRKRNIEAEIRRAAFPRKECEKTLQLKKRVFSIIAHPDRKHIAFVTGDDANAEICVASVQADGIEIERKIRTGHGPRKLLFSYDGSRMITENRDGTTTVLNCSDEK